MYMKDAAGVMGLSFRIKGTIIENNHLDTAVLGVGLVPGRGLERDYSGHRTDCDPSMNTFPSELRPGSGCCPALWTAQGDRRTAGASRSPLRQMTSRLRSQT